MIIHLFKCFPYPAKQLYYLLRGYKSFFMRKKSEPQIQALLDINCNHLWKIKEEMFLQEAILSYTLENSTEVRDNFTTKNDRRAEKVSFLGSACCTLWHLHPKEEFGCWKNLNAVSSGYGHASLFIAVMPHHCLSSHLQSPAITCIISLLLVAAQH